MKKAKIILTVITVFAIIGGALAFKTARYNEFPLWTITGTVTTSTTIAGQTYTATVPACRTIALFATDDSPVLITNPRFTIQLFVKATRIGGTQTTLAPYAGCPIFPTTFVTIIP